MLIIGFWQSYKKFNQKKEEFKKRFKISWDRCVKILEDMLIEKGVKTTDNIIGMFNNYCKERIFNYIMKEIVTPWERQVNKERIKSFKFYSEFRIFKSF